METEPEKTVFVFVMKDNQILLLKRCNTWFEDKMYCPPGGAVDEGETPAGAATRELYEETGLVATPDTLKFVGQYTNKEKNRIFQNYSYLLTDFEGTANNKEPDRHEDLQWFDLSNLPANTSRYVLDTLKLISEHE